MLAQPPPEDEYELIPPPEDETVRSWRRDHFHGLGFGDAATELLTDIGADWHQAEKMLAGGCTVELALAVLA